MSPQDTITHEVRAIVARIGELDPSEVTGEARLADDLAFDSLQLIELAATIEERFAIGRVDETAVLDIVTVHDVESLVARLAEAAR
ncbi:acyl carrier protein (plasmid) [Streptomyces sp. BI20]|uniref:acyl carrier protein n=1 Tax=Streptomyces sp. BI20 TaxID=3403460 RepID=UPI003C767B65